MDRERLFSPRNPWFTGSVALTLAITVVTAAFGFVWLPRIERNARFANLWDAICSVAGAPRAAPALAPVVQPSVVTTRVVLTPTTLPPSDAESIGRGATLALRCTMCHGARGLSEANSPNLAGQYAAVIYKELEDYKSGARTSAVMMPIVADLSQRDMRDLAAYYAYLPRPSGPPPSSTPGAPRIVESGAPMRGIAPCGACHGSLDNKLGSPWLEGQPAAYLHAQLQAFATGARHNDIGAQMRNVARQMSPDEMEAAASYYAGRP
ncbi:MAG TPA: c-type cytochrome [Acetobacteraceae bacterium]|nr:c-type cytochrome [Acetobacteraceae bacterium]